MISIATIAFLLFFAALAIQVVYLLKKEKPLDPVSPYLILVASVALFVEMIMRSIAISFVAVTNTFESLVFFSGVIGLLLFVLRFKNKLNGFILFVGTFIVFALLAIASSPIAPKDIQPPIPALQSYWLVLHVTLAFIGEAFFVVSFGAAIYYLSLKDEEKKKSVDKLIYTSVAIGYPIFTVGALIFGAIWAQFAWGAFWSWDPKETWALITFFIYTIYLHTRLIKQWRGRVGAVICIVGFLSTLFTFFGVNFLLSGLHSYG